MRVSLTDYNQVLNLLNLIYLYILSTVGVTFIWTESDQKIREKSLSYVYKHFQDLDHINQNIISENCLQKILGPIDQKLEYMCSLWANLDKKYT